jgi:hypothetical protein
MHLYNKSEELVKELETAVQQEENESRKSQYQTILQTQKNLSANLKSLGQANATQQNQTQQTQQGYTTEFATEQNVNTAKYTSETQAQAKNEAQRKAKQDDSENKK